MLDTNLLVACIFLVLGSLLYFFYWNKVIGFCISIGLRALYWTQGSSSIWLELGSFHISLLSGRIFLKDIKYHSSNQTLKIVKAEIVWRYWLRRSASKADLAFSRMGDQKDKLNSLKHPCRVQIEIDGLEWFIYNRTASYDAILDHVLHQHTLSRPSTSEHSSNPQSASFASVGGIPVLERSQFLKSIRLPKRMRKAIDWIAKQLPQLEFNDLLPLGMFISKGAIVLGNVSTPTLLAVEFHTASGNFGVVQSRSQFDLYKQVLSLEFSNALAHYVPNSEYRETMVATGANIEKNLKETTKPPKSLPLGYSSFLKWWRSANLYRSLFSRKARRTFREQHPHTGHKQKHSMDGVHDPATHEYAIERRVLEAPLLELSYYADVVGDVPSPADNPNYHHPNDDLDIGNGDVDPEWGVDIVIRRGVVRYGPWSDRQRGELQKAFFPPTYLISDATPLLKPGDKRQWTDLRFFVELRDETTLEIPFRESSKNWQWDGLSEVHNMPKRREPASIHIKAGDRSSLSYVLPMFARPFGYEASLEVHLDTIVMTSSLNDIRTITAESARIRCGLPSPLIWNAHREWKISVSLRQPLIYLLRDHIDMFTDLGKDWSTGPPSDYHRFVPTTYKVDIQLIKYIVNLYCNDLNLVDKPLSKEENTLLCLNGDHLRGHFIIPMDTFRPEFTDVTFAFEGPQLTCDISLPKWHTHFLPEPHNIAFVDKVLLDGSFLYYADVCEDNIDCLTLSLSASHLGYKAMGWSIRYLMLLQANYFGSYTHYTTLSELLRKFQTPGKHHALGDPLEDRYRPGKSNMMQVELEVELEKAVMIYPAGLPGYEARTASNTDIGSSLCLDLPELQVHLRLHDYFMEMSLNTGPIYGWLEAHCPEKVGYFAIPRKENPFLVIDGLDITANRLFGPMPRTSTYLCAWEIVVGNVYMICSADEARVLMAVGTTFQTNFSDIINAPATEFQPPPLPDVTFLKVTLGKSNIIWNAGKAALAISLSKGLSLDNNDMGGQFHRKVTVVRVPDLSCKVLLDKGSAGTHWLEAAEVVMDVNADIYSAPVGWRLKAFEQARYVEREDHSTHRFERFLAGRVNGGVSHKNGVYLPQPTLPQTRVGNSARKVEPSISSVLHDFGVQSDSDVEHSVNLADRDARIAHIRSITPRPENKGNNLDHDQALSTGDETDDADLSDASNSSDYDSDEECLPPSLLKRFSKVSRTYKCRQLKNPSLWRGSPFLLCRDSKPLQSPVPHSEALPHIPKHMPSDITHSQEDDDTVDCTVIRLNSSNGVQVRSTPLLFWAALAFESDLEIKSLSPELFLDNLMAKVLTKRPEEKAPLSCIKFDIQIPQIHLHLLQDITLSEEVFLGAKPAKDVDAQPFPAVVALLADCGGLQAKGRWAYDSRAFSIAADTFSLNLSTAVTDRLTHFSSPRTAFKFYLSDFVLSLALGNVKVAWNEIAMHVGHHGPEYVLAFLKTAARCLKPVKLASRKWQSSKEAADRVQLEGILNCGSHHVDRLSIIQPSYLVQHDIPKFLREDPEFRLLISLRENLPSKDDSVHYRVPANSSPHEMDPKSLLQDLLERYMDPVEYHAFRPMALAQILAPKAESISSHLPSAPSAKFFVTLSMQRLSVTILDPHEALGGRFSVERLNLALRTYPTLLLPRTTKSFESVTESRAIRSNVSIVLDDIEIVILPALLDFTQHILRVHRRYASSFAKLQMVSKIRSTPSPVETQVLDFNISLGSIRLRAIAATLTCEFGLTRVQLSVSALANSLVPPVDQAVISLLFGEIFVHAKNPQNKGPSAEEDILASLVIHGGKFGAVLFKEYSGVINLKSTSDFGGLEVSVPRSALRLYHFITQWQESFLPAIESTTQELLSEIQNNRKSNSPSPRPKAPISPHFLFRVSSVRVSLQVMPGTWLSWDINDSFVHLDITGLNTSTPSYNIVARCTSQVVAVRATERLTVGTVSETRLKLALPAISFKATFSSNVLAVFVLVNFISVTVKPSHWDTFLAVQQKFGQDFTDLVTIVQETRSKMPRTSNYKSSPIKYRGYMKLRGFRIGLRAATSALYLECFDVQGDIDNNDAMKWHVGVTDLALSLVPRAKDSALQHQDTQHVNFMRDFKSAFVIIDFRISARSLISAGSRSNKLVLNVTKIHAVMQASSISEFGDFVDYLQTEILRRHDERKAALTEFKNRTQNIFKTFDVKLPDVKEVRRPTLLAQYTIDIGMHNIGVAIPLAHDLRLGWPTDSDMDVTAVRAFLFSINSIKFSTHRGETGQAVIDVLSLQFVPRFRQTVPTDFAAGSHPKKNRLSYPNMQAQLKSSVTGLSRKLWVNADVSGFVLDLDPTISEYVFSLVDVYRLGKERVARLNLMAGNVKKPSLPTQDTVPEGTSFHTVGFLTFRSGKVRIHSRRNDIRQRTRSSLGANPQTPDDDSGIEIFNLPVVSVWSEYRSKSQPGEASILLFKSTIHSSQNTLTPELLPFLADVMQTIEQRLHSTSSDHSQDVATPSATDERDTDFFSPSGNTLKNESNLHISFSLRIDQSKLQLTCQPDVNVIAGLYWESGGFMISVAPSARRVTFTGSVEGLTVGLKHGFLTEECVKLDARDLAFSIAVSKAGVAESTMPTLSVVVQTELHGQVRFSRLQDILCFKAVWLDRIPILNSQHHQPAVPPKPLSSSTSSLHDHPQPFQTAILVRIRQMNLQIDLGHSITTVNFDLRNAILRTKISEAVNHVAVSLDDLSISAKGNVAGQVNVSNCVFETIRRTTASMASLDETQMLEMRLTSSALTANLESEHQKLLHYRAEPLEIKVFDDWSSMSSELHGLETPLQLSFSVAGPEISVVITVSTIPILLKYANIFKANLETQRDAAARESKTFRRGHAPLPDNPLSAVAEAMIQSTRHRLEETSSGCSYTMRQHISLRLSVLRLVIFPRTMGDLEAAELFASDILAELHGSGDTDTGAERQLHLSFQSLSISKYTRTTTRSPFDEADSKNWLLSLHKGSIESNIVGLPAMDIHMESQETQAGEHAIIVYDFDSRFTRRKSPLVPTPDSREDIFITLNMSLYVWLTGFKKGFQRGMDEATKAKSRAMKNTATGGFAKTRKGDSLQISTLPSQFGESRSPRLQSLQSPPTLHLSMPTTAVPKTASSEEAGRGGAPEDILSSPGSDAHSPVDRKVGPSSSGVEYRPRKRQIERLTMRQLGEGTPDLTHPFFKKTAGFTLEDMFPRLIHEYAAVPLEQILEALLKLYTQQLLSGQKSTSS